MKRNISILAWPLLALSIAAWLGVAYAGSWILQQAQEKGAQASSADQESDRVAYALRLHSLAADTSQDRADLEALVGKDVVAIAKELEATGKSAGAAASVSSASPEGPVKEIPGGAPLRGISFIVQLQGSYASLMRAVQLYELLPTPSSIQGVEIERLSQADKNSPPWHMTLRIRIFTTADISA